ncbi:MAG: hypothetical protein FWH21_03235 [Kiritimatiellaeota bacterium]|nr:hypothetical protein [Kiritimatiellota bacterium]
MSPRSPRAGLTIIELISALVLFVIIFALLMTIFRIATRLWAPDQSNQQLQAHGDTVMDILATDFYQAVADTGTVPGGGKTNEPCFVLDCNTNTLASTMAPQIVLYFARQAAPQTPTQAPALRNALDAVFYVCYSNCLSRHAYPLERDTWTDETQKTLGDLIEDCRPSVGDILSAYNWFQRPAANRPNKGTHSLLADQCAFAVMATLPPDALKNPISDPEPLVTVDQCETYVVPDFLDAVLILYDEVDWNMLGTLSRDTTQEGAMRREFLGKQFSKRMAYPAKGGARR